MIRFSSAMRISRPRGFRLGGTLLWLLLSALLLSGCTAHPSQRDDFAYAATPFTATLRGTYTPADGVSRPIAATVVMGTPVGGDPQNRAMTLTFTQPAALAGVVVTATGATSEGRTIIFAYPSVYGEVTATARGGEYDGLLRFAEALLPRGDVAEVSPVGADTTRTVTRRTADGGFVGVYLFSEGSSLPLRVTVTHGGEVLELVVTEGT